MKRFLIISLLLVKIVYGQQLTSTDTLCFPIAVIQKLLIAAEQKKVLQEQVVILNERIENMQLQISQMTLKDSVTVVTYENQIRLMQDQRQILEKTIRRYKRQRFFTHLGIGTLTGIFAYLYINK